MDKQLVMVTKAQLITLLGDSTLTFAMFLASGSLQSNAIRILFENVESLDLNSFVVQQQLMPILLQAGAVNQAAVDRVNNYVSVALGIT